ncbi:MAG: hypothetical protein EBY28_24615 [Betaproteobacteria bacterium]|nr:hypothetical protein [Betaproteobacteria bacterium]
MVLTITLSMALKYTKVQLVQLQQMLKYMQQHQPLEPLFVLLNSVLSWLREMFYMNLTLTLLPLLPYLLLYIPILIPIGFGHLLPKDHKLFMYQDMILMEHHHLSLRLP